MLISEAIDQLEKVTDRQYTILIASGIPRELAANAKHHDFDELVRRGVILLEDGESNAFQIKLLISMGFEIDQVPSFNTSKKLISNFICRQKSDSPFADERFVTAYKNLFRKPKVNNENGNIIK